MSRACQFKNAREQWRMKAMHARNSLFPGLPTKHRQPARALLAKTIFLFKASKAIF